MAGHFEAKSVVLAAEQVGFTIIDRVELPARQAKLAPPPRGLHAQARAHLQAQYPRGLYEHQADAMDHVLRGGDVCLSTSTASGKSLVFMAIAADLLLREQKGTVLALYPARALVQDQMGKWEEILEHPKLKANYIDGGVPTEVRIGILASNRVILMTPDVAHAWLLGHLNDPVVRKFVQDLRLVVLDEAHVYDGVFGTNMAYLMRRLQAASGDKFRLILSTATLGSPKDFVQQLTGRSVRTWGLAEDSSATPPKTVLLARPNQKPFDATVLLIQTLAKESKGRFLAFGDSRKMVEQLVAAANRATEPKPAADPAAEQKPSSWGTSRGAVLPYRSGYEPEDRQQIQKSLASGALVGVVSTSALELGIDIGEIDLVVLLSSPPSVKSLWQRIGRCGRRNPGVCLILDSQRSVEASTLQQYLNRPLEPSWLYLENRYIQYANALAAALEASQLGGRPNPQAFRTLPESFKKLLDNELNPRESVPSDLYFLKQRAQADPHHEFPLRSGTEPDFQIQETRDRNLGHVTLSQALREAYPGAIYHYMARPYRIVQFAYRDGKIRAKPDSHWVTTQPLSQTMVFPQFSGGGVLNLFRSERAFLAEAQLQVSERTLGFVEKRGSGKPETHTYQPGSPYYQRPLDRFFETTGVCWLTDTRLPESAAHRILGSFCTEYAVQERDLGLGRFHARQSPLGPGTCEGWCIYDGADGSLRLTQRLAENFRHVVMSAATIAQVQGETDEAALLKALANDVAEMARAAPSVSGPEPATEDNWVTVVAPDEYAMLTTLDGAERIHVLGYRYTPRGLMYDLEHGSQLTGRSAGAPLVKPINGETKLIQANLVTGETRPLPI